MQAQKQFEVTKQRDAVNCRCNSPVSVVANTMNGLKARQGEYAKKRVENLARWESKRERKRILHFTFMCMQSFVCHARQLVQGFHSLLDLGQLWVDKLPPLTTILASPLPFLSTPIIATAVVGGKKQGLLWINVNMKFNLVELIQLIIVNVS